MRFRKRYTVNNQTRVSECFGQSLLLHTCHVSLLTNLLFVITSMSLGNRFTSVLLYYCSMLPCSKILRRIFYCVYHYTTVRNYDWMTSNDAILGFVQLWTTKHLRGMLLSVNWAFFWQFSACLYMDKHFVSLRWSKKSLFWTAMSLWMLEINLFHAQLLWDLESSRNEQTHVSDCFSQIIWLL